MERKGISTVIASILMLMIVIALGGTAYLYISGTFTSKVATAFEVVDNVNNQLTVRNTGTEEVTSFRTATLDGTSVNIQMPVSIQPGQTALVKPISTMSKGTHTLRLCTSSMCNTAILTVTVPVGRSCLDILNRGGSIGDGVYDIVPIPNIIFPVFCDMTNTGFNPGTGRDGAIALTTTKTIDSDAIVAGRTAADAVNFAVTANLAAGSTRINLGTTPTGLAVGDEILIINMRDPTNAGSSRYSNWDANIHNIRVGRYETHYIVSIDDNILTLDSQLGKAYNGATYSIVVQRVPHYTDVTIHSGGTLTVSAFSTGTNKGGVLFFRATGAVDVQSGGSINADAKGYPGGDASGTAGAGGVTYNGIGGNGGDRTNGATGQGGGGGGGGKDENSPPNARGSTGAFGTAGGGGGGGGFGSGDHYRGGGGGGGGHGTRTIGGGGGGGNGEGDGGNHGGSGSDNIGGNGGDTTSTDVNSPGISGGGGGGGGGTYGSADLSRLMLGSGGGGGGRNEGGPTNPASAGGAGGGIIMIHSPILTVSGTISANGQNGYNGNAYQAGGGGGAGGSVYISANTVTGEDRITATGGSAGSGDGGSGNGGAGGSGRIKLSTGTRSAVVDKTTVDPLSIPNLMAWYRADSITGVSNGATVSSWDDSSGNRYTVTQGNSARQPTYRTNMIYGMPTLQFDGTDDSLTRGALPASDDVTLFIVGNARVDSDGDYPFIVNNVVDSNNGFYAQYIGTGQTVGGLIQFSGAGTIRQATSSDIAAKGEWYIYAARLDASANDVIHYKNGDSQAEGPPNSDSLADGGFHIASLGGRVQYLNADISEIIIYNRILSAGERNSIHQYLEDKYGIVASGS